jgi:hypothetical protein
VAESFFATLKVELVDDASWATRQAARAALFEYRGLLQRAAAPFVARVSQSACLRASTRTTTAGSLTQVSIKPGQDQAGESAMSLFTPLRQRTVNTVPSPDRRGRLIRRL